MSSALLKVVTEAAGKRNESVLGRSVQVMRRGGLNFRQLRQLFYNEFVLAVYLANAGNQCKAAKEMGLHRNTYSRHFLAALKYLGVKYVYSRRVYRITRLPRALVKPMPPRMPVAEYPTA